MTNHFSSRGCKNILALLYLMQMFANMFFVFDCFWKLLLIYHLYNLQFTVYNDDTKRKKNAKLICFNSNFKFGEKYLKVYDFFLFSIKKVQGFYLENLSNIPTLKLMLNIKSIRVIQSLNTLSAKVKLTWQATTIAQTGLYVGIYVCWWVQIPSS